MANIMIKPRLAIIGTGNIAHFHCEAFTKAGFDISHAAGSLNSKKVEEFGRQHAIKNIFSNPNDVLKNHKEWDLLLLSPPTEKNNDYINKILDLEKPVLIEKPVAINPSDLLRFKKNDFKNIRVAYNRRFYSTIQRAREFISNENFVHTRMELPEGLNQEQGYQNVLLNSAHGIDLLLYLFPGLEIQNIYRFADDLGRFVTFKSQNDDLISLNMNWNSPSNFMLNLEGKELRLEIKPFEASNLFQGMDVIQPTAELPLRQYVPKKIESISSFPTKESLIKPGFLEQAMELRDILDGNDPQISASLHDAFRVQELLHRILY